MKTISRKELMEDLRKEHFKLGHDGQDYRSIYHKDYPGWDPTQNNTHFVDDNMLRRTNYTNRLPQNQHNHYGSVYKLDFPNHPIGSASLNEEKKADLRKHHFEFGFDHKGVNPAP
jgi:hypothetical protein